MSGPKKGATLRELKSREVAAMTRERDREQDLALAAMRYARLPMNANTGAELLDDLKKAAKAWTNAHHEASRRKKHLAQATEAEAERVQNQTDAYEGRPRCKDGGAHLFVFDGTNGEAVAVCVTCGMKRT